MSDKFSPLPLTKLLSLTLNEIRNHRFLGIPGSLFFIPGPRDPFRMQRYGRLLETPLGVAAGPHTQLSQNIIAAWLCGARYIELKTIQTLDELEVSKPCIDMQDEGYNCEWSQELRIEQSFHEYLNAWILIHILRHEMGFTGPVGTLFNMSVGYNYEGILKPNVQWFLQKMSDCGEELLKAKDDIRAVYPDIDTIEIPGCISDHITLSTMHGCPPDEIEKIGLYLIRDRKLHTTIKLNPTLLGPESLREILNENLGFSTQVPDEAFAHDLKYPDALGIIQRLQAESEKLGLQFGIKLTNTLESLNHKGIFNEKETMMYMSGRALHPISINVAAKLQEEFGGTLDISFSGGADCFNISALLATGLKPVTVCSDLLKPGGYGRLWQYIDNLKVSYQKMVASTNEEYIIHYSGDSSLSVQDAALKNLLAYAGFVKSDTSNNNTSRIYPSIKTERPLGMFDCIHAPCEDTCPTHQGIPEYMFHTSQGETGKALETIRQTNPFPRVTGMICDHTCQLKCTRMNYDESLHIRDIKRFIAENAQPDEFIQPDRISGKKAAIIGAGPAGLSCAWYLRKAGMDVDIYEAKSVTGGMISSAIPGFRLTDEAINADIRIILKAGIRLHENFKVTRANYPEVESTHDVVFLAAGAQISTPIQLEGIDSEGVTDVLNFLYQVRKGKPSGIGKHVVIIGGGNTAMDAARTAFRLVGEDGSVTIAYRRTISEMPADKGEIKAVLEEGIRIMELVTPEKVVQQNGRVTALSCSRNILAMKGKDGRPIPVKVPDSGFDIPCDTLIPALGQSLDIDFLDAENLARKNGNYKTVRQGLYLGGDAMRGASTAINAIADGRLAAEEILADLGTGTGISVEKKSKDISFNELMRRKSIRVPAVHPLESPTDDRRNFNLVMATYSPEEARQESSRCLLCDEICNTCVTVCPNLANFSYRIDPVHYRLQKAVSGKDQEIRIVEDEVFKVEQELQILNIRDFCNECGNCVTFCPSAGKPFTDKPGLCLTAETFNTEHEAYMLSRLKDRDVLIYKHNESIRTLTSSAAGLVYETDQVRAHFEPGSFQLVEVEFLTPCVKEYRFHMAAEMNILLKGALQLAV